MLYDYIISNYKEGEPIFFSDIFIEGVSRSAVNQQMKSLCNKGLIKKYDKGLYYIPKKTMLKATVGPSADMVARYRFVTKGEEIFGYYSGNSFANQLGISMQVPRKIEIVSNNSNSSPREIEIGGRKFLIRKSSIVINRENVYVLQLLELLKNIEVYMDGSYDEARVKIEEYIDIHDIRKESVNRYIREFPINVFKNYYELGLDNVFAQRK